METYICLLKLNINIPFDLFFRQMLHCRLSCLVVLRVPLQVFKTHAECIGSGFASSAVI
jgi:hypothetical protein